jgi:glycosyltransferase involved in cell wall biosynthesis
MPSVSQPPPELDPGRFEEPDPGQRLSEIAAAEIQQRTPELTVVMPVFNEAGTLEEIVGRIQASGVSCELVIVDDASTDGSAAVMTRLASASNVRVFHQPSNRGKGAAIRFGNMQARGAIVILQDADLEYDPGDYKALIEPITNGTADVVYGSRFLPGAECSISWLTYCANRLITWCFNRATGRRMSDVETCYKAIRRELAQEIAPLLVEERFGIEIELTARLVKMAGVRIVERPIRYRARSRREGKKIGWRDGVRALWCIWRYR